MKKALNLPIWGKSGAGKVSHEFTNTYLWNRTKRLNLNMDIESFRNYCLDKKGVTEEFPFGPDTLVFKVMGKMFALTGLENVPFKVSLKCNPTRAQELREEFDGLIEGAYHMNKKHWNTIQPQMLPPNLVEELIDHSYGLVVSGLTIKQQQELKDFSS